jgi:hypothetical protein
MRPLAYAAVLTLLASPALAQTAAGPTPPSNPPRYDTAPWWMAQPILASLGKVTTEVRANRASFTASFQAVEPTAARATQAAADKIKALTATLGSFGADKVRMETSFSVTPLYDQYRDKDGNLIANQRGDKIERYQVNANVSVEVRDMAVIERAFNAVASSAPTSVGRVYFNLQPDNVLNTELFNAAVADAAQRARLAATASGARLGAVKLIDPTGRACETDVLVAGADRRAENEAQNEIVVTGHSARSPMAMAAPPPPPPPPSPAGGGQALDLQVSLQPPLVQRSDSACVVYALN